MIYSIFWIIFSYTGNPKLTMFLCERAIILFIEYITLSNTMVNSNDMVINLLDVKLFIFKKTLGPLKIFKNNPINKELKNIQTISILFKDLINKIFIIISGKIRYLEVNMFLEKVCSMLSNVVYKLNYLDQLIFIESNLYIAEHIKSSEDLEKFLNEKKFKLEAFYYIINTIKNKSYKNLLTIYENLEKNINSEKIYDYLNNNDMPKIVDTKYFKKLMENMVY